MTRIVLFVLLCAVAVPGAVPAEATPAGRVPATTDRAKAPTFPSRAEIRAAQGYATRRRGVVSAALTDSRGQLHVFGARGPFVSASLVKPMLLVAYLRGLGRRGPSPAQRALLGPMIVDSDNDAATEIYRRVGAVALHRLARRAAMRHFSVTEGWASGLTAAADQARFFRRLPRLVPASSRPYALRLLSSISRRQRWGFSLFSEGAGFITYFKGGWRRTRNGRLVHEAALFERGRTRVSLAVLTDGNPSHSYGTQTLRGIAALLFPAPAVVPTADEQAGTPAHRRAGLVDVHRFAPDLRLDLRYATRRNLTGRRLPGYCRPWALLLRPAARDLAKVERDLNRRGLGLQVYDAYRPLRSTRALVAWAYRTGREELVGTYIARRSKHNLGSAVDLTLVRLPGGRSVPMGSGYDDLSRRAHTRNARGRALRNRLTLARAMSRHGFRNYSREWWHYEHRVQGKRHLDLTLGCRPR